jgi:5'-phosphate synthase pdxT subunit
VHPKQGKRTPGGSRVKFKPGTLQSATVSLRIGILGLQGACSEHVLATEKALANLGLEGSAREVRKRDELAALDGLILPGGESTTISKLLRAFDLHDLLVERATREDFPVLGTCAGLILLSKEGDGQVAKTDTRLLGLMDMTTNRNAFGRQRESFEAALTLKGFDAPVPGVFIRAPAVVRTWGACEALGTLHVPDGIPGLGRDPIVAARQGNRVAIAFHPELTSDTRVHEKFVSMVRDWK